MTDRYNGLFVILDHDIREDDAEPIISAIKQIRGVSDVRGHVAEVDVMIAEDRARRGLVKKLWEVLKP